MSLSLVESYERFPVEISELQQRSMHVSDTRSRTLKHLGLSFARIDVEVHYKVYRCPVCGRIRRNAIPFKAKGHNMTWLFFKDIADALERDRSTISTSRT